ncbi:DNA methyltransferase [Candidatus Parabeggiatoa sp. HSG14]|uniref:DNA methyltransferase n=1 Tax=Candidatus Parabeggiatoa sp. HSG14 TaxID=3055593 RepID=UPI0025A877CE|nr:DNA methyltransferase [Thiotrichales bacterium HSG14]
MHSELFTLREASIWASDYLKKEITLSNISYLVQYGRIPKIGNNGGVFIRKADLEEYYRSHFLTKEAAWKEQLGEDLNWTLSFSQYKESQTTKHVHRLHPYKGKFIPQLVEYFLDTHTDQFKKKVFFKQHDIVLDPFCGSGTTLVQSNELGLNAIGIDVSAFNALISNAKIDAYDFNDIQQNIAIITNRLWGFIEKRNNAEFEQKLLQALKIFNDKFFPSPDFRYQVRQGEINEKEYGKTKEADFLVIYNRLVNDYQIELNQASNDSFLDKWFLQTVRDEINFVFEELKQVKNVKTKQILAVILSRTIRSCRATTHADLASLKEPVLATYFCKKHGKICKPLFSILSWWDRYSKDTLKRLLEFNRYRSNTFQMCLTGDSRDIDIFTELDKKYPAFGKLTREQKIKGIFSSPPYVGLINYHEQHAYAYDLFDFDRKDELEIGPLYKGQGIEARKLYMESIAQVLLNSKLFMQNDYDVFLVANDKYGIYPQIAELANMKIVNQYKRPVLNRVEKDRSAYSEIIFHLKE